MPTLWGRQFTREELMQRIGRLEQVAGVRLVEHGDGHGARRARPRVPYRLRVQLRRPGRSRDGHRPLRARRSRPRLAERDRVHRAVVLRAGGAGLAARIRRRAADDLRHGARALHGRGHRRALQLPAQADRALRTAWPRLVPAGDARRLRRALGWRRVHPLGRRRDRASGGLRGESGPAPPRRGEGRRGPADDPRRGDECRLGPHAAHVPLSHQCRLPGAGRWRRDADLRPATRRPEGITRSKATAGSTVRPRVTPSR